MLQPCSTPSRVLLSTSGVGPSWFRLPDDDEAVKKARRFAAEQLTGAEPEFVDDVALCVSEVLGNAVRYAQEHGPPPKRVAPGIWLGVRPLKRYVHVLARDPYPVPPKRRTATDEDESGRGLFIVRTLAAAVWTELRRFDKTVHVIVCKPGEALTVDELDRIRR
jgi:anti-sigma regulatory factor (Ser/Thr protein kinase)